MTQTLYIFLSYYISSIHFLFFKSLSSHFFFFIITCVFFIFLFHSSFIFISSFYLTLSKMQKFQHQLIIQYMHDDIVAAGSFIFRLFIFHCIFFISYYFHLWVFTCFYFLSSYIFFLFLYIYGRYVSICYSSLNIFHFHLYHLFFFFRLKSFTCTVEKLLLVV